MAQQAIVTLTAITKDIHPSIRRIELNPNHLSIPIGRASRSTQKGLISADDNAWVDSPVMSRDHAKLMFDNDQQSVLIEDIRSMHGTTINGVKIASEQPHVLSQDDILEFGIHIRRGPDEYPACMFRVSWELCPWSQSPSFQVPDSSDVEDLDYSEDESNHNDQSLHDHTTPEESPQVKSTGPMRVIDLTEDDFDDVENSNGPRGPQGLSEEESFQERKIMKKMTVEDTNGESEEEASDEVRYLGESIISRSVRDESSDSDNFDEYEYGGVIDDFDAMVNGSVSEESSHDSNKENDESEEDICELDLDSSSNCDLDQFRENCADEIVIADSQPAQASTGLGIPDSHAGASSNQDKTSDFEASPQESKISPSAAPALDFSASRAYNDNKDIPESNMRTTIQESVTSNQFDGKDTFFYEKMPRYSSVGSDVLVPGKTEKWTEEARSFHPRPSTVETSQTATSSSIFLSTSNFEIERQPSPSDAALVKPYKITSSQSSQQIASPNNTKLDISMGAFNPATTHGDFNNTDYRSTSDWQQFTSQKFANDRAKTEFFRAMEENRAKVLPKTDSGSIRAHVLLQPPELSLPLPHLGDGIVPLDGPSSNSFELSHAELPGLRDGTEAQEQPRIRDSLWRHQSIFDNHVRPDEQPFIDLDSSMPDITRKQSPELDMTSAVVFNKSKVSSDIRTTRFNSGTAQTQEDKRFGEKLFDSTNSSLKRKADKISDVLEEELLIWGSGAVNSAPVTGSVSTKSPPRVSLDSIMSRSEVVIPEVSNASVVETPDVPPARPSKKLKRFAEKLGYAALGGVAVGAGLFSVLVATAPEFI